MVAKRKVTGLEKSQFLIEVQKWAKRIRARNFRVRMQPMKRKWASCSKRRNVTFNTELLHESQTFREYVIVHELLHLKVPNHGKLFKSLLRAYVPNYASIKPLSCALELPSTAKASQ